MTQGDARHAVPTHHAGVHYTTFLPWLARVQDVTNYLEIGVNMGSLLSLMAVENAIGVDPNFILNANVAKNKKHLHLIQKTSDRFFIENSDLLCKYAPQLAFLDGMHTFEYLLRDFINTEATCTRRSLIAMHDCLPLSPQMCHRDQGVSLSLTEGTAFHGWWTGDVWKIVPILRKYRPDLKIVCIDAAPTGLVFVTNLDPSSTVLNDQYLEIVNEYGCVPDTFETLSQMYTDIDLVSATNIMDGMMHGIYFRN